MMKDMEILIDTNIVLDWLLEREPFLKNARDIMEPCIRGEISGHLASHTLLNIFYIARKHKSVEERKEILRLLCNKFNVIGIDKQIIMNTLGNDKWPDLEDGLQMQCAITENLDYIVTRDLGGFENSTILSCSPEEFFKHIYIPASIVIISYLAANVFIVLAVVLHNRA